MPIVDRRILHLDQSRKFICEYVVGSLSMGMIQSAIASCQGGCY